MGFNEFLGNERIVTALRGMLSAGRVPSAMLFSGRRGVGKYTLARLFAQAANCERLGDDTCDECAPCRTIAQMADAAPLIERGLEERGSNPGAAATRVPLLVQTHPDVTLLAPDPVRARNPVARPLLSIGQLRAMQRAAYFKPSARRRVFIVDGAETMRPDAANALLKVLEEPPDTATIVLLTGNEQLLLPTVQSRCLRFAFAPVAAERIEALLARRTKLKPAERKLAAHLAEGSVGAALEMDLEESTRRRRDALRVLELGSTGLRTGDLFAITQQLAKQERGTFENLLDLFYSLLSDVLELVASPRNARLRNPDLRRELEAISQQVTLDWVRRLAGRLDELKSRTRRNINRQLGLDSVALSLSVEQPIRQQGNR